MHDHKGEVQKQIRGDKKTWVDEQCSKVDEFDRKHKSKELYRQIKATKGNIRFTSQLPIKDKDNNTLTGKGDIMARWREYGQNLFCLPEGEPQQDPPPEPPPDLEVPPEPPPLLSEIEAAIKLLSYGKSPGLDNLPADLIKTTGELGKKSILLLCQKIWTSCAWPEEWRQQEFVLLHKSGDQKLCSNYRTIALISHISKILLYIVLNRLKNKMEAEIAEEQAGFRA